MKKGYMKKWVKALRSGKYKQGRSFLKREDGTYCCLGVLTEVCGEPLSPSREAVLKEGTMVKSGIKTAHGRVEGYTALDHQNDTQKKTFSQIADFIEAHWQEL